jgi:hypothetical protein
MNKILADYALLLECLDVSGAEYLELLQVRDSIAEIEADFGVDERNVLLRADRRLMANAGEIYQELARFVDLKAYREGKDVSRESWWWYLDVLACLPEFEKSVA